MTKEQNIETYLMNKPRVVAEMLYDTITRYEVKIKEYEEMKEQKTNEYIYHFFAEDSEGYLIDGLFTLAHEVKEISQYRQLKKDLIKNFNLNSEIIIKNLSLLSK